MPTTAQHSVGGSNRFKKRVGEEASGNHPPGPTVEQVPNDHYQYFNQTYLINTCFNRCPHLTVSILDHELEGLADTGANVSIISSLNLINRLGLHIQNCNMKVRTADQTPYSCLGYVNIPYKYRNVTKVVPTLVVPEIAKDLILGVDFLRAFNFKLTADPENGPSAENVPLLADSELNLLLAEDHYGERREPICFHLVPGVEPVALSEPVDEDPSLEMPTVETPSVTIQGPADIITQHVLTPEQRAELFEAIQQLPITREGQLGRTNLIKHQIELIPGATPKRIPSYRWSPAVETVIDAEMERLRKLDVIEECEGSADFLNPLLPIKKPTGKWRICLDSRRLNSMTKRDEFPIPNMTQILQRIKKVRFFSVIDLTESYYQVELNEEAKNKTAFRTNKGLYRFKVMPFGLTNAPATMCRLMSKVLGHDLEPFVYVYLDDIIITSETFEEHIRLIRCVAERLRNSGLTINILKSKFCQTSIKYLGYVLSDEGLATDVAKIQPILDYPAPRTVKDVRRLLGLAGFYQKFVRCYSDITTPITNLLKKGRKKFLWTQEADEALQKLKEALVSAPILANPDFEQPFIIETDSSDLAIGSVLTQIQGGERKCIAYFSKKLSSTQRRYSATERECLAVLLSIENFRHFVEGNRFVVQTDAMSLTFLQTMSIESKSPRIARWALKLSKYDVVLQYKKGSENISADALSRSVFEVKASLPDPYLEGLRKMVETEPGRFSDFKVVDGEVYKFVTNPSGSEDPAFRWKQVIAPCDRRKVLEECHNEAHLGFLKTLGKIRERYYWPRMASEIKRYCASCQVCKESKVPNQNVRPPCGKPKICTRPWEMISIDFLGPYPRSRKGNVWILVICDFFSKFVLVQCMRTATAPAVCAVMENLVFNLFGAPAVCITDNAKVFMSDQFTKTLEKYKVTQWNLAVYHPSPNPSERVNRVIVTAIRCALNKHVNHRDWDESVQLIAKAIRTSVHDSTGYTPYFVNFGRNMVSSGAEYDHLRELQEHDFEPAQVQEDQKKLYEIVRTNLHKAYQRYSKPYNLRSNAKHRFQEGDLVYKRNVHQSDAAKQFVGKFGEKYSKARVRQSLGTNTYVLEDEKGKRIPGTFHGSFLKKA